MNSLSPSCTNSSSIIASMDSTFASSITAVNYSFLIPYPIGTNLAVKEKGAVRHLWAHQHLQLIPLARRLAYGSITDKSTSKASRNLNHLICIAGVVKYDIFSMQ